MSELPDVEKLRILEVRASYTPADKRKPWELVAEETHHAKGTVIAVNKWFQALPWNVVGSFPEATQRLHDDYFKHLKWVATKKRTITAVTFAIASLERIGMVDQVLGAGDEGSYKVFLDLYLVMKRPVRLDGVEMNLYDQHVKGSLILQDDRMRETGTYLVSFNIAKELCIGNPEAEVVVYANGQDFRSQNKVQLSFGS